MANKNNYTEVAAFKHKDKRVNIPPRELAGFMADDERAPKTCLYPRDPSLDPQLVWSSHNNMDSQLREMHCCSYSAGERYPNAECNLTRL